MPSANTLTVSLDDMRAEVRRELVLRRKVYRRWVDAGTMTRGDADWHIARLEAVSALLAEVEASRATLPASLVASREVSP